MDFNKISFNIIDLVLSVILGSFPQVNIHCHTWLVFKVQFDDFSQKHWICVLKISTIESVIYILKGNHLEKSVKAVRGIFINSLQLIVQLN